jgi:putative membrane protein
MNIARTIPVADWWGMHGDVGAGWMILMMVLMVLFWAAVILGIVWLVRSAAWGWGKRPESVASKETPAEILERRFAEGAISVEDYRERRQVLGNGTAAPKRLHKDESLGAPGAGGGNQ